MDWIALLHGAWESVKEILLQKWFARGLPAQLTLPCLTGVSCVVTGCTSGIGLHTARELAKAGAHVIMACRNTKAAEDVAQQWQMQQRLLELQPLSLQVAELDLASLCSVRSFAARLICERTSLDILVNNAGIYRMGEPQKFTEDGNEQHMQVNHLGPALLTLLLLPLLIKSQLAPGPRVVNVNSMAHHFASLDPHDMNMKDSNSKYLCISSYAASKFAHLMFLRALSWKFPAQARIIIFAVHPGIVSTNLVAFRDKSFKDKSFWRFEAAQGARSVLYCSTCEVNACDSRFLYYGYDCRPARICTRAMDRQTDQLAVWDQTLEILRLRNVIGTLYDGKD